MSKIGWVGTGVMGLSMSKRLMDAGHQLYISTRTRSRAKALEDAGAVWCDQPKDVAEQADVVFTIVGYPKDVEQVFLGENGLMSSVRPGHIFVDMTTTRPSLAQTLAETAEAKGAQFIDAPVSGGDVGARTGNLSIMIGGADRAVANVMPLFEIMGKNIVHQGPAGSGQHTKMCNQITIAGTMIGVSECLVYGHRAGLDLPTVLRSIASGAAGCWTLDNLAPRVLKRDLEPGFFIDHFIKDMEIALDEARRLDLCLPGLALAHQLYRAVKAQGAGLKGTQALVLALEHLSNVEIKTYA